MQYSPLVEQLIERLQSKEQLELEFKECKEALTENLWETVSAFANTQGGWLLLGVNNKGQAVGVMNPSQRVTDLFNMGRNRQKISTEVWSEADISVEQLKDKDVIVVRVPAVSRTKRPVFIRGNPMNGTFIRRHDGDYRCNEEEVRRMFREASIEAVDSTVLKDLRLDTLNQETIVRYRQRLQNRNPEHEFNDYAQDRFLHALAAIDDTFQHPTIAGLLVFGMDQALRKWRKRHLIDFRVTPATIRDTDWTDRIAWEGNLFDSYFKLYPKLTEGIPIPHRIEAGDRIEDTPTHIALREALVNLLVHADYAETDASLIIKCSEGYYFRNPGSSRVSRDDLLSGNRSDPRNPNILFMFRLVGLAEEAGSGLPKIIRAWRTLGFQIPNLEIGTERYEFGLALRNAHLFSDADRKWLHSLEPNLTESEQVSLIVAKHDQRIDNERLRSLVPMHPSDATKVLTGLRDKGLLKKESDTRGAFYRLPDSLGQVSGTLDLFRTEAQSEVLKDVEKGLKDARENLRDEAELLKDMKKTLRLRMPRAQKRKFIADTVVRLCALRPFSASELADAFKMSPANMVTRYIKSLQNDGRLEWTGRSKFDKSGKYKAIA